MLRPLALSLVVLTGALLAGAGDDAPGRMALEVSGAAPVRVAPLAVLPDDVDGPHAFADLRGDATGRPVLFDPCRPVSLAVRRDGELPGADALLTDAVAEVSRLTGLDLVRQPDVTGPIPSDDELSQRRPDGSFAPALVAWSSERERESLEGGTVALGGGTTWTPPGRSGEERLVNGLVVLDTDDLAELRAGPDGEARLRAVLLHELAHLVGLGHVDDPGQLMHRTSTLTGFAPGDLRGLAAAGRGQCFLDW